MDGQSNTTVFTYDASGKLVAEYLTEQASSPTVNYTATDPLGSPRVITNKQGQAVSRRDFMPFGEEIAPDAAYRTAALKYGIADGVRQKFTGYQRDEETDLDFAEARYYYNDHGRFTAVDPLLASGKSANPQTFNRYVYTMNRPLVLTDPSGMCTPPAGLKPGQVGLCFEAFIAAPRIGPGGIGHGDGRTFSGNDPKLTARVTVWGIAATDTKTVGAWKAGERVSKSVVGGGDLGPSGTLSLPDNSQYPVDASVNTDIALQGTATTNVEMTRNDSHVGEADFGKSGIDVTMSIANGTNGAQQLGKDLQTAGKAQLGAGDLRGGAGTLAAGKMVEALAPAGTIDGKVTVRITGNGNVRFVRGESRGYPSYAVYAYTMGSDGKIQTVMSKTRDEHKIQDLTKPMTPFPQ
ncbi:MAG: hypothetical protein K1X52_11700 [Pyrinomonadaceae bacterium]|nr:hypothetical protein [Pyrinomonadaceae bacterium]